MPDPQIRAAFYLSPALEQWWRWDDNAQVLTWNEGQTIAFSPEVEAVIDRLALGGLPPFGALTLLLAACHDDWADSAGRRAVSRMCDQAVASSQDRKPAHPAVQIASSRVETEMTRLLVGLDAVGALPKPLRSPLTAKALLAEVVFETSKNRGSPDDARLIARAFHDGLASQLLRPRLAPASEPDSFAHQVSEMATGLARVIADALKLRLQTGLDQSILPATKDLSPPEKVRQLLAELRSDEELSGLAKLAHDLMAAVAVPGRFGCEELQMGGVSDLTNRGPLDRLLLSELAQDDMTLAVRVAVNEAMYLRRESPPKEPPHNRAILIDAGVRMWGVPRVFATAVALALSAMADPAAALQVYRATDAGAVQVDLTTHEGVVAHLAVLEAPAHPGAALAPFFAAVESATAADGETTIDAFVLTHADAASDHDFLAAISALGRASVYIGAVDRDGSFKLVARTRSGQKPIRDAKLSLDEILAGSRPKRPAAPAPLIDEAEQQNELPAIFRAEPFPLLLPFVVDPMRALTSKRHGLVAVTDDGRLLHWRDAHHGARELSRDIPRGQLRMLNIDEEQAQVYVLIVRGKETSAQLVISDFTAHSVIVPLELREPSPVDAFKRGGFLFLVSRSRVDAYLARDGQRVASVELPPDARRHRGRFFRMNGEFVAVAYDGSSRLRFEKLPSVEAAAAVFDRAAEGGYWIIAPGKVADHQSKNVYPLPSHLSPQMLRNVSPDGNLLEFVSAGPLAGKTYVVDLEKGGKVIESRTTYWPARRLGPAIDWSVASPVQLRKKFTSIGLSRENQLVLVHRGRHASRALGSRHGALCFDAVPQDASLLAVRDFEPYQSKALRMRQQIARWPDGSRAWLDSRGLLHLRSSDTSLPELTFVLRDDQHNSFAGLPAAWSSDRKVIGPDYFTGDEPVTDVEYFMDLIRQFTARLRS